MIIFSFQVIKKLVKIVDSDYLYWPFGSNADVRRNNDVSAGSYLHSLPRETIRERLQELNPVRHDFHIYFNEPSVFGA